jgi:hypothetical protein
VAVHRGDGVGEQQHRIGHRLDAAAAHLVVAGLLVPAVVELLLLGTVGEGPIVGIVVGGGGRGSSEHQRRGDRGEEGAEHGVVLVWGGSWGVTKTFPERRPAG